MNPLNIGGAAAAAGITPKMVRHYESLGLIPAAARTEAGYRLYGDDEVAMLRFIRQSRTLGFSMKQIESLLALWRDPRRASREVKALASAQLAELEQRQRELDEMKTVLAGLVEHCAGDEQARCAILEQLATPPAATGKPSRTRSLKQALPGSRPAGHRSPDKHAPAPVAGHAGLMAWSRTFSAAAPS